MEKSTKINTFWTFEAFGSFRKKIKKGTENKGLISTETTGIKKQLSRLILFKI